MGGPAVFAGAEYQAELIAYIHAHILAQAPLEWFAPEDDTPVAVEPETGGAGDDLRVEFRGTLVPADDERGIAGENTHRSGRPF